MKKYHISNDGVARECNARKIPCTLGFSEEQHYATKQEAQTAYENNMAKNSTMPTMKKKLKADKLSANNSYTYAKYSFLNNHLHNSSNVGSPQELLYYSSPAGRLELQRRIDQDKRNEKSKYPKIAETLDDPNFVKPVLDIDEKDFTQKVHEAEELIRSEKIGFNKDNEDLDHMEKRAISRKAGPYLLEQSHQWLQNLTAEEQEVIAFSTSNGSAIFEASLNDEISDLTSFSVKSFIEKDIDELYDNYNYDEAVKKEKELYKKKINELTDTMMSAMKKAPMIDEPIAVYRGTDMTELKKILGQSQDTDSDEIVKKLYAGGFNGSAIDDSSNMTKIPKSASVIPWRAESFMNNDFDKNVVLKIQQRSMASPAVVSAWGVSEGEIFTNPYSKYTVTGSEQKDDIVIVHMMEEQ